MNPFIRLLSLAALIKTSLLAGVPDERGPSRPQCAVHHGGRPASGAGRLWRKITSSARTSTGSRHEGSCFRRAYCQQAICNASRASFLTGLRPDSTGVYDLVTHFRKKVPDVVTLPQIFKKHGYHTQAIGKIYHPAFPGFGIGSDLNDPASWSEAAWLGSPRYYYSPLGEKLAREAFNAAINSPQASELNWIKEAKAARQVARPKPDDTSVREEEWKTVNVRALATEAPDVSDETLYDGQVAERAIAALRRQKQRQDATHAERSQPFFLAVGFLKPHLPFIAPRKYWDLYDPEKLDVAANPGPPYDAPAPALAVPAWMSCGTPILWMCGCQRQMSKGWIHKCPTFCRNPVH
jgi:iduronate 2-sulfatase